MQNSQQKQQGNESKEEQNVQTTENDKAVPYKTHEEVEVFDIGKNESDTEKQKLRKRSKKVKQSIQELEGRRRNEK